MTDSIADILALVRAGAVAPAREIFAAAGLYQRVDDPAVLTLNGRLLKAAAGSVTGSERSAFLAAAAEAYNEAARVAPATYPLINAATLSLLSGTSARAAELAAETLALLDSGAHEPDTPYWLAATRAEALLLLGRETEARVALDAAIAGTPRAWEDHAVTLRQFRLILAEQGGSAAWLDACSPPAPIHFAGPIGIAAGDRWLEASIEAAITAVGPGIAVGALAAGFDIIAAELLVRAGAQLHVVLPAPPAPFVAASVAPAGDAWLARFERLLDRAAHVDILDLPAGLSAGAATLAEEMAIGCAIRSARSLDTDAVLLRLAGSEGHRVVARSGLRLVEVRGGAAAGGAPDLAPPDHADTLLGCRHADAGRLADLTGARVQIGPPGAFVILDDLAAAAEAALALFDAGGAEAHVVLDHRPPWPDGSPDTAALDTLLAIPARGYPIATRPAAFVLEARGAGLRLALAGASEGPAESVEFFSLWRGAARSPDPRADAAS